jgi:hypothetical protein
MRPTTICLFAVILSLPAPLAAQDELAASVPSRCVAPEYRQFDFWLGEWKVTSNGTPAGTNSIVATQGGCVLQESWQGAGPGGITGGSFNIYDHERRAWHQTWVDASGTLLLLDGGIVDGAMVLQGERPAPGGKGTVRHRIAWTPNEDGTVRQLWEASQDGGANWSVIFDGLYTRAGNTE